MHSFQPLADKLMVYECTCKTFLPKICELQYYFITVLWVFSFQVFFINASFEIRLQMIEGM